MDQRENILIELKELASQLAEKQPLNVYSVPAGYFENLSTEVLDRIKAYESLTAADELRHLSPYLSKVPKETPYTVPLHYFETVPGSMNATILNEVLSASEETAAISPLIGGLKKDMPFAIPAGYFESLDAPVQKPAKVISMGNRRWMRYAAAAVITGIIAFAGYFISKNQETTGAPVLSKVSRDINKLNEVQQQDLVDFLHAGMSGTETVDIAPVTKPAEIRELLEGVSEEELQTFQQQTEDLEEVLMIN